MISSDISKGQIYKLRETSLKIKIKDVMGDYVTFYSINGPRTNCIGSIPYWILNDRYIKETL